MFLQVLKQYYLKNIEATNTQLTTSSKSGHFFLTKYSNQPTSLIASIPNHRQFPRTQREKIEKIS